MKKLGRPARDRPSFSVSSESGGAGLGHHHIVASILNTFTSGRVVGAPRCPLCAGQAAPKPSGGTADGGGWTQSVSLFPAKYTPSPGLPAVVLAPAPLLASAITLTGLHSR